MGKSERVGERERVKVGEREWASESERVDE